jgi:transcription antitermination factor NusG
MVYICRFSCGAYYPVAAELFVPPIGQSDAARPAESKGHSDIVLARANPSRMILESYAMAVPDSVIEAIQSRAHANGCLYPHAPASAVRLATGTRVRPVEGAFVDLVGNLSEMSDGKRVKVLLSIMGRQVPVVMPKSAVEVVE